MDLFVKEIGSLRNFCEHILNRLLTRCNGVLMNTADGCCLPYNVFILLRLLLVLLPILQQRIDHTISRCQKTAALSSSLSGDQIINYFQRATMVCYRSAKKRSMIDKLSLRQVLLCQ